MPTLTPELNQDLADRLAAAAAQPHQHDVLPLLYRLARLDPLTSRPEATAVLLELIRTGQPALRTAAEVLSRVLAGDTVPNGQVVSVGNAAEDPLMVLARDIIQLTLQGENTAAGQRLEEHPVERRAALLSVLAAWVHYDVAGIHPATLLTHPTG